MMTLIPFNFFSVRKIPAVLLVLWLLSSTAYLCQAATTDNQKFPEYNAIRRNVAFWEKVYSHYTLTEAVIHDTEDLSKIYEVIPLLGDDLPGAARFNSIFQQQAVEKYGAMLKKLANQKPSTRTEAKIASLFSGKNRRNKLLLAADNVRSQRGQKERFLAGVIQSGRYIDEIKRIFRTYHLPEELAYLPHVESSFNYRAYSKIGAAGIWQFTRTTGKEYLTIDYTIDERLDPILATYAAAKYLQNSYSSLNNWPLALTSYNYGLAGMMRAVKDEGDYERVFQNYNKGYFKFASKNFYPEFLAALNVAKQLEKNPKVKLDSAQPSRYLTLPGYVHINVASRHFHTSPETIVALNPALRPSVISGEKHIPKGYTLRLPAQKQNYRILASIPASKYIKEQKPSLFHRVKKGDTAISIARLHRISPKNLMKVNNLDKYATIYLDQRLRIPKPAKKITRTEKAIFRISAPSNVKIVLSNHNPATALVLASEKQPLSQK